MALDVNAAEARMKSIDEERRKLDRERTDLMYAIQREADRPLVGRYFKRNGISRPDPEDDNWIVWTRVDSFDDDSGARGVEFHHAGGEWYSIKLREHVRHDEVGDELTEAEFYADIQPLLDALTAGGRLPDSQPRTTRRRRVRVHR